MKKSFGLFLKEYEGTSWKGRQAARHWRTALKADYLAASQYTRLRDVEERLRQFDSIPVYVAQGLELAWLQFRAQRRAEDSDRRVMSPKV